MQVDGSGGGGGWIRDPYGWPDLGLLDAGRRLGNDLQRKHGGQSATKWLAV